MNDETATVETLKRKVHDFAVARDWLQFHSPKNVSMALAAESGELMEHFLWTDSEASHARARDEKRRDDIRDELADIVIYALEFANVTGIDLASAIEAKMAQNA
ncbi:MAG: nucleotide pyrophosphohydrolase, partial [Puniceicoccales bacterium]